MGVSNEKGCKEKPGTEEISNQINKMISHDGTMDAVTVALRFYGNVIYAIASSPLTLMSAGGKKRKTFKKRRQIFQKRRQIFQKRRQISKNAPNNKSQIIINNSHLISNQSLLVYNLHNAINIRL
jgi:hypothetical protein